MKIRFILLLLILNFLDVHMIAQDVMKDQAMADSTKMCCDMAKMPKENLISVDVRYYFSPLASTVTDLLPLGYSLEETAFEVGIRFRNFPKIYYYQQLGNISDVQYVGVNGFGIKERIQFPVLKNSAFTVTPYLEGGVGYYRLTAVNNVNGNSFATVFNAQTQSVSLDNWGFTGDAGLLLGYSFSIADRDIQLSLNGGYQTNLPAQWSLAQSLSFREKMDLSSPYAGGTIRISLPCCRK